MLPKALQRPCDIVAARLCRPVYTNGLQVFETALDFQVVAMHEAVHFHAQARDRGSFNRVLAPGREPAQPFLLHALTRANEQLALGATELELEEQGVLGRPQVVPS